MTKDYYVYVHRRKDNNTIFYVGKGRGERYKRPRNYKSWKNVVDQSCGFIYEIICSSLGEEEALRIEKELILNPPKDWELINKSSSNTKINLQLDLLSSQVYYDPSSPSGLRHSFTKGPVIKDEIAGTLKTVNGRPEAWSVKIKGRLYTAARVVWILQHGSIDDDLVVDHIDRNVSNNYISNLRLVSVKENNANRSIGRNNKTGVNGVQHYFHQGFEYYTAYVSVDGKSKLVYFSTKKLGKEQAFLAAVQCRRESEQKASICQK